MMKSYVLPVAEIAEGFFIWTEEFCTQRKLDIPNKKECIDVICAIVDDAIANKMKWCDPGDAMDRVLVECFPWYDPTLRCKGSARFYDCVVDHAVLAVDHLLQDIVENNTWTVWYVRRVGSDLLIERGEDYRVLDWERRMESGEWTSDSDIPT